MNEYIYVELGKWFNEHGYTITHFDADYNVGAGMLEFKKLSPPDLSVHITDGMGSQDRVGG